MSVLTEEKTRSVSLIRSGTVLDHIFPGKGIRIVNELGLIQYNKTMTLGLHLPSKSCGLKDLVKVEGWEIDSKEISKLAIFSFRVTINIIREYKVEEKFSVVLPQQVDFVEKCLNPRCISNFERIRSTFLVQKRGNEIFLVCKFCKKKFSIEEICLTKNDSY